MSDPFDIHLVKALADLMIFSATVGPDVIDDMPFKMSDAVGDNVLLMTNAEQNALAEKFRRVLPVYLNARDRALLRENVELLELGAGEELSPDQRLRMQRHPPPIGVFNPYLINAIGECLVLIDQSDGESLNPEAADRIMEAVTSEIRRMSNEDQAALNEQLKELAPVYAHDPPAQRMLRHFPQMRVRREPEHRFKAY